MGKRIAVLGSAIAIVLSCVTAAQAEVVTNEIFPVDEVFFVPCANDGAGESVVMSGNIHFVAHFTFNDNTVSGMFFANTVNFSGTGQVTGDHYRRTGVSTSVFSESQQGSSFTTTSAFSFQLVGQGAGNNLVVHTLFHVTINAQGDTTVSLDTLRADCK